METTKKTGTNNSTNSNGVNTYTQKELENIDKMIYLLQVYHKWTEDQIDLLIMQLKELPNGYDRWLRDNGTKFKTK